MSGERRRRGRPKGTGIDDWERLLSIASLIERNPKLKVTTAIRELGFTDPSVIRRLRDKFKAHKVRLSQSRLSQFRPLNSNDNIRAKPAETNAWIADDDSARSNGRAQPSPSQRDIVCLERPIKDTLPHTARAVAGQLESRMLETRMKKQPDQTIAQNELLAGARTTATIYTFQAHALEYLVNQPATAMPSEQHETVLELLLGAFAHATQAICD